MKQSYTFRRTLSALVLLMVSTLSWAYDFEAKNAAGVTIYYRLINNKTEAEVTYDKLYSDSYSGEVIIPETVTYSGKKLSVTSIGDSAFYRRTSLTSVTIPNSVTSIGSRAFSNCSNLTSVYSLKENPFRILNSVFSGTPKPTLYVPEGKIYVYKCAGWARYFRRVIGSMPRVGNVAPPAR